MKRLLKAIVFLLMFSLVFDACKKNSVSVEKPQNYVSYKGKVYKLSQCLFFKIDTIVNTNQDTVYYSGLIFLSPELKVTINNGLLESISGTGTGFSIEMVSSEISDSFVPGCYETEYDPSMVDMPGTINSSNAFFHYNSETDQGTFLDIDNGVITISGTKYEIEADIELKDNNGSPIKGYFKGTVTLINAELDKSGKVKQLKYI